MTDDKKEDNKSDKVISLEDFKKTEKELTEGVDVTYTPDDPVKHIIALAAESDLKQVVITGVNQAGRFEFFSSCESAADTTYLLEAFKKVVMDTSVGMEKLDD